MALSPTLTHDLFYTCHIKQFTAKQIVWYFFALPSLPQVLEYKDYSPQERLLLCQQVW